MHPQLHVIRQSCQYRLFNTLHICRRACCINEVRTSSNRSAQVTSVAATIIIPFGWSISGGILLHYLAEFGRRQPLHGGHISSGLLVNEALCLRLAEVVVSKRGHRPGFAVLRGAQMLGDVFEKVELVGQSRLVDCEQLRNGYLLVIGKIRTLV